MNRIPRSSITGFRFRVYIHIPQFIESQQIQTLHVDTSLLYVELTQPIRRYITNNFNNGAWNPNSLPGSVGQYWEALYEGIRKANLIIENVEKYNTPDNPQQDGDLRNRIGEMYFMRGYFHMLLMRMYGEAPYIDYVVHAGDNMDFKKESVHAMVEKILPRASL